MDALAAVASVSPHQTLSRSLVTDWAEKVAPSQNLRALASHGRSVCGDGVTSAARLAGRLLRSSLWGSGVAENVVCMARRRGLQVGGGKKASERRRHAMITSSLLPGMDGKGLVDLHDAFLAVGVGLPCTVMECGDVFHRSTLQGDDSLRLTAGGVSLILLLAGYLWSTPGVAPGFFDMFVLAPLERLLRRPVSKDELVLGKKLGEGAYGTVFKATSTANPGEQLVVKKANEFGAVEIWMNERTRRACPDSCADFIDGFVEQKKAGSFLRGEKTSDEFWLVWRYEGDSTLADIIQNKDFPYNAEESLFGGALPGPKGSVERENKIIRALMTQILTALQRLHSTGIVHRDIKPQNIIFNAETGKLKIIDLGAAADLRVGINYNPNEFLLDPRYAAPEQYIMSTQTPQAPPPPVAATLSPVLWQMNLPDRFDMYSTGLIFLQMVFPSLRSDGGIIQFNRQLKRCNYDLAEWRALVEKRGAADIVRGFEILDMDGGHGWALVQAMVQFKARRRISAGGALAHPYFSPGDIPVFQRVRLAFLRLVYRDNSEISSALVMFMARTGTESSGGLTEATLQDLRRKERKAQKKASPQRNALASALRLQRKVAQSVNSTFQGSTTDNKKKEAWWNRWQSE